jgi:outer membrane protein OmpA-like peptidoglycan-associated protein
MKKILFILTVLVALNSSLFSQTFTDSWGIGFGFTTPRLMGDIPAENFDHGAHLNIIREFTEVDFLRFSVNYLAFTALSSPFKSDVISFGFDYGRKLAYCSDLDLFVGAGGGALYSNPKNSFNTSDKSSLGELYFKIFAGGYFKLSEDFGLKAEAAAVTVSTDKFDGFRGNGGGGLFGGSLDSYVKVDLGFVYWISRGEKSDICDLHDGMKAVNIDYNKIEEIVKKYSQKAAEVDYNKIEDMIKKHSGDRVEIRKDSWVLIGVNFDFNKSSLAPESYPILVNAVQVLLGNPDMKVEIQGHTDNIGSDAYNKKLSLQRAETVKKFLVSKGVNANRLTTVGLGSSQPISDNKTADGRAFNRRIEFKVK